MARQSFRYDPKLGKMVEIDRSEPSYEHFVRGDMAPVRSPLDGTVIEGRKQYEDHMKRHHVVPFEPPSPRAKPDPTPRRELIWQLADKANQQNKRR